jgi:ABC-type uncharacterized transport system, duplicated ATPase component
MIAMALAAEPDLLVADEPTTALDVTVQAQILDLLADIQKEFGMAVLIITHDLAVVRKVADTVALMRHGEIVETAPAETFFTAPKHPYARELFDAIPTFKSVVAPCQLRDKNASAPAKTLRTYLSPKWCCLCKVFVSATPSAKAGCDAKWVLTKWWRVCLLSCGGARTLALLGGSGCGKTTVAKTLLRLLDGTAIASGEVKLLGRICWVRADKP